MSSSPPFVLIVDDDPQFGGLVAKVAEKCGLGATVALSAREAWTRIDPAPLLVLLDLNMPDADGLEVLRELAFRRCPSRIHVLSGADPRILKSAVQIGSELALQMGEPLAKPITVAQLRELFGNAVAGVASGAATSDAVAPVRSSDNVQLTVEELRTALENGDLFLVYQPILELETLTPVGAEALIRWQHSVHGVVAPARFVPLAESSGLVVEMTEQIFVRALEFAASTNYRWRDRPLGISVNLATAALVERDLAGLVLAFLRASGLPPDRLTVEVTETAVRAERTNVLEVLSRLRLRGVHLSIDDFGTGTSSLERLDMLPCTELKIERAFVADVLRRPQAEAIVSSTLDLARRFALRTVAEGIERADTLAWLRKAGCQLGQGFLFTAGLVPEEFSRWLAGWDERREPLLEALGG